MNAEKLPDIFYRRVRRLFTAGILALAAVLISPGDAAAQIKGCCEPSMIEFGTWPTFQGDSGRRGIFDQDMSTLPFRKKWEFSLGPHTWRYYSGVSVWSSSAIGIRLAGRPFIFAGAYDRNLYKIDALSGREMWRFTTGSVINAAPAFEVVEGVPMVFIASADRTFYAIDARSGERVWQYETYPWSYTVGDSVAGSPVVATTLYRDVLFATMWNNDHRPLRTVQRGEVFAFLADTGELLWRREISSTKLTSPSWMMVDDRPTLFVASEDGALHALDARDGSTVWRHISDGAIASTPVAVRIEGMPAVITANRFGMVRFLSARTGAEIWAYKAGHEALSTPAVACFDGRTVILFGAGDRSVHAVCGQRGARLWKFPTGKYVVASPAVATVKGRPVAFISSLDNHLYGIDLFTGEELMRFSSGDMLWPYETRGVSIWASPSVLMLNDEEIMLVYPAHDGKLYAFTNAPDGQSPVEGDAIIRSSALEAAGADETSFYKGGIVWLMPPLVGLAVFAAGMLLTIRYAVRQ